MNTPTSHRARQSLPLYQGVQSAWPWPLFAALIGLTVAAFLVHLLCRPALRLSQATLRYQQTGCVAEFEATNNTNQPVTTRVLVTFGLLANEGPSYDELGRSEVVVTLTPRQNKWITCGFSPQHSRFPYPNTTRAELLTSTSLCR